MDFAVIQHSLYFRFNIASFFAVFFTPRQYAQNKLWSHLLGLFLHAQNTQNSAEAFSLTHRRQRWPLFTPEPISVQYPLTCVLAEFQIQDHILGIHRALSVGPHGESGISKVHLVFSMRPEDEPEKDIHN